MSECNSYYIIANAIIWSLAVLLVSLIRLIIGKIKRERVMTLFINFSEIWKSIVEKIKVLSERGDYMKSYRWIIIVLMITILLSVSFPRVTYSNAAEPPSFTIIALNPSEDLSLSILLQDESQIEAIELDKENRAWETYYRFFYHMIPLGGMDKLEGALLFVESSEQNFRIPLPTETFKTYNNLLTLDLDAESLIIGQSPLRVPILVTMRVVFTLLIEGIIFYLFGFRQKRSWLIFLVINLLTQGGLNAMITGPSIGSYWILGFIFGEIIILIVEMIAFASLVKEHKKSRRAIYTIIANLASLVLGGILISYLPL